jgi:adenine-specific DNA methylase
MRQARCGPGTKPWPLSCAQAGWPEWGRARCWRTSQTRLQVHSVSDAGRVIAGSARGTRLRAPGEGTRPLSDRVKETLFAILEPNLAGANVLDLFAGSGAGGIEALSRGAAHATFVERDPTAAHVIGENLAHARLAERGHVAAHDVHHVPEGTRAAPTGRSTWSWWIRHTPRPG